MSHLGHGALDLDRALGQGHEVIAQCTDDGLHRHDLSRELDPYLCIFGTLETLNPAGVHAITHPPELSLLP